MSFKPQGHFFRQYWACLIYRCQFTKAKDRSKASHNFKRLIKWKIALEYLPEFVVKVAPWIFLVCLMIRKMSPFQTPVWTRRGTNQTERCYGQKYNLKFHVGYKGSKRLNDMKQTRKRFFKTVRLESAHSFVSWIGSSRLKSSDIPSSRKFSRSCIDEHF